jgi:hypothetical protein
MFLVVEENSNTVGDERVFATSGDARMASQVEATSPAGISSWWDVTGVDEGGAFIPAQVIRVDDSSDGTAWLVYGGLWGLRLKKPGSAEAWSLEDKNQWGLPFLVLDSSGTSIR